MFQKIKYDNRKLIVHAKADRRRVHHLQTFFDHFDIADFIKSFGDLNCVVFYQTPESPNVKVSGNIPIQSINDLVRNLAKGFLLVDPKDAERN